ncbi:MAG TPA: tetratricopeptide repeat protein [Candidatus Xenobia bacterium]|jgi:tetratricopeptide (TPR) repeat protein
MRRLGGLLVVLGGVALAAPSVAALATQAAQQLDAHQYRQALATYESALKVEPEDPELLVGAAKAAEGAERWDAAVTHLRHVHRLLPGDWRLEDELLCDEQSAGHDAEAEALANDLVVKWKAGTDGSLSANTRFPRAHFQFNGARYDVYQGFQPPQPLYTFVELSPDDNPLRLSVVRAEGSHWRYVISDPVAETTLEPSSDRPTYAAARAYFERYWSGAGSLRP